MYMHDHFTLVGQCCGSGEEPGPDGLHLCGIPALPHPGVSGGVEHGKLGGGGSLCYTGVRYIRLPKWINNSILCPHSLHYKECWMNTCTSCSVLFSSVLSILVSSQIHHYHCNNISVYCPFSVPQRSLSMVVGLEFIGTLNS